ncbi:oxygenase MpaB family protein [Saccharopolyspora sp. NFXS83]|nr:oxygenase MpaB family protein [Saccharopolyspora sp. NFXS83]
MTGENTFDTPDRGHFGPDAVSWHLHGDPAMWAAGICSLYLQALHPRAVAGVVQNSDFQRDPLGRLRRTSAFVGLATYGGRAEVDRAASRVRHVHSILTATDPRDGAPIRLDEPELLRWVHCAEVASFAAVVRRGGFPLTDVLLDRYFDEQRRSAGLVGLDPATVPGSRREMAAYFARMRPVLARTEDAELIYRFLHRPFPEWWRAGVNLTYRPVGHLAYSLLPGWARRIYGRPAFPRAAVTAGLRAARATGLAVPGAIRWRFPADHVLRAVERLGEPVYPSATAVAALGAA